MECKYFTSRNVGDVGGQAALSAARLRRDSSQASALVAQTLATRGLTAHVPTAHVHTFHALTARAFTASALAAHALVVFAPAPCAVWSLSRYLTLLVLISGCPVFWLMMASIFFFHARACPSEEARSCHSLAAVLTVRP